MLESMYQPAAAATSSSSPTFAGLLAALAAPGSAAGNQPTAWHEDGLGDDVATLSYERALRAHSRYKSADPGDLAFTQPVNTDVLRFCEALPDGVDIEAQSIGVIAVPPLKADAASEFKPDNWTGPDRNLKCASVTIRMSKAECAQLHKRAAEAGLTVSAYLRSCTFETESLRALVKDTLAQLRTGPSPADQPVKAAARRSWRHWLDCFWPRARAVQHTAQA